ncbi:PREDICTED: probable 28S ribosomal protein S23, mitochondrial [Rhagoletis zephyria]|uniref:probable 28S ribosomal protein S23, mitochondrial n=1 Tax=Rhagoletis zephyria TaxID=28612 RepID=UPI0008115D55|nr:PREDICTED: probable 28S ribosomal protein S23, mitochondrial [Rhagoletis zephyria]
MAQSRLEKIGTIFTRVDGLIKANAMRFEDRPIWYDLYAAFPPKLEPRFDRPAQDIKIKNIFYAEDVARAKFQKKEKQYEIINLLDTKRKTQTQNFIEIYQNLKSQNPLDEEKLYETSVEMLGEQSRAPNAEGGTDTAVRTSLLADFVDSKANSESPATTNVDIKKLFSE